MVSATYTSLPEYTVSSRVHQAQLSILLFKSLPHPTFSFPNLF